MPLFPNHEDELLRQRALQYIHTADVCSLLCLYGAMRRALAPQHPNLPTVEKTFVALRKKFLHSQLESLEKLQPELAARIQEEIDRSCSNLPMGYHDE